ncbi:MAG: DUF4214 domain-containing protein [Pseudomonadota bacterium]
MTDVIAFPFPISAISISPDAPVLLSMTPREQAALSSNIVLVFDRPIFPGLGSITILSEFGITVFSGAIGVSDRLSIVGTTLTIDLPQDLDYITSYTLHLSPGIVKGENGVAFSDQLELGFTTVSSPVALNLVGTAEADTLRGSEFDDSLSGADGGDTLYGLGGNDLLDGGAGSDYLRDDEGNNVLLGGAGNDALYSWSTGNNRLDGGAGDDAISGGRGTDTLIGGDGNDILSLSRYGETAGSVTALGGDGDDTMYISIYDPEVVVTLSGGAGLDTYSPATVGALTITDFSAGDLGDVLDLGRLLGQFTDAGYNPFGGQGYLRLQAQGGSTVLQFDRDGAAGSAYGFATVLTLQGVAMNSLTDLNFAGVFRLSGDATGVTAEGSVADDILDGSTLDDTLIGHAGNDTLYGYTGQDKLEGGLGGDRLFGGSHDDSLFGGADDDMLDGEYGNDRLDGGDGNDRLHESAGDNTLLGGAGNDNLESSGQGRNLLDGGEGHDFLLTRFGNETLLGGGGDDVLEMNNGLYPYPLPTLDFAHLVVLEAGEGNDIVRTRFYGSDTTVRATGGAGVDTFELHGMAGPGKYVITDFKAGAGGDMLDLLQFIPRFGPNLNPFDPSVANMRLVQQGADLVLQYAAFLGSPGTFTELVTLKGVTAASLTSANFSGGIAPDGSSGDLRISGSSGADSLSGGIFNDTLDGGAGADILTGNRGNDTLNGGDGNDVLNGGFGKNLLNGGSGLDTAVFEQVRSFYDFSRVGGNLVINNTGIVSTPLYQQDTVVSVERAKFGSESWAFDIDGVGGQVYRLYEAAFNRAPDKVGLGFWMAMVDRGALGMAEVSQAFVLSPEFAALYANASNAELVTRLYQNLFEREPDPVGKAFWVKVLDDKLASLATVLTQMSESAENQANLAQLIGYGVEYIPYGGA